SHRVAAPSNGEVEGLHRTAQQSPRAHTVFPRPRRVTTARHGPLQRLLESRLRNKTDFDLDVQALRELENLIKGLAVKLRTNRLQRRDFGRSAWRLRGGLRRRSSANDRFSQQESSLISRRQGTHEPAMTFGKGCR